jgi:hypothetical protein
MIINIQTNCISCKSKNIESSPAVLMPFISHRVFNWKPIKINKNWKLKTIKNGMAFSLVNTLSCKNCGMLFLDIRFNESQMDRLYNGYRDHKYNELREKYEPGYIERDKLIKEGASYLKQKEKFILRNIQERAIKKFKILDYGGDDGTNTPFKKFENIKIFDLNKKYNEIKNKLEKFDLIICSHVIEHASSPEKLISKIKKLMKKNSYLYIEVPFEKIVYDSHPKMPDPSKKKHWHEHINFFTKKSLLYLFSNAGLKIIDEKVSKEYAHGNFPAFWKFLLKLT